ncbi:MAG: HAD-IB family hydrolase [Deltaproteobacteria bacterium]|nr:HAD-IB family hydrolase [Deltaproteobacteria bacterium]
MKKKPAVVFFDLDHTIIGIDSTVSWKYFLVDNGMAPKEDLARADYYWDLYCLGKYPVDELVEFQYREFSGKTIDEIRILASRHFEERIRPHIYSDAQKRINAFSKAGIPTVLVTGTDRYIAEPIAEAMQVSALLATELVLVDGKFTGEYSPPFLLKEGKIKRAEEYCRKLGVLLAETSFFADSVNDIELLAKVGHPVVVNTGEKLLAVAEENSWPVERWVV